MTVCGQFDNDCVNSHNAICAGELSEHKPSQIHAGNLASLPELEPSWLYI